MTTTDIQLFVADYRNEAVRQQTAAIEARDVKASTEIRGAIKALTDVLDFIKSSDSEAPDSPSAKLTDRSQPTRAHDPSQKPL